MIYSYSCSVNETSYIPIAEGYRIMYNFLCKAYFLNKNLCKNISYLRFIAPKNFTPQRLFHTRQQLIFGALHYLFFESVLKSSHWRLFPVFIQ